MKARVYVTLKNGVLDPQGSAIKKSLNNIGINSINSVTQGKYFEIDIAEDVKDNVVSIIEEACDKLLVNNVIENFEYELIA